MVSTGKHVIGNISNQCANNTIKYFQIKLGAKMIYETSFKIAMSDNF